mgnify:FL=1
MAEVIIKIDNDQFISILKDIKDDLSVSDKRKILEILFSGRGITDSGRLLAEIADIVYNS